MLLGVFFALVLLTFLTVFQANFHLGSLEIGLTVMIATVKASLVMYFFMHLGWEKPFNILVFISSAFFLALFLGFTMMDRNAYRQSLEPIVDQPYQVEAAVEPVAE